MDSLSPELLIQIFENCDILSMCKLSETSIKFYKIYTRYERSIISSISNHSAYTVTSYLLQTLKQFKNIENSNFSYSDIKRLINLYSMTKYKSTIKEVLNSNIDFKKMFSHSIQRYNIILSMMKHNLCTDEFYRKFIDYNSIRKIENIVKKNYLPLNKYLADRLFHKISLEILHTDRIPLGIKHISDYFRKFDILYINEKRRKIDNLLYQLDIDTVNKSFI